MIYDREQVVNATWLEELIQESQQFDTYYLEGAKVDIAFELSRLMKQEGVSKAELARRLKKSRAYVTKVLQGGANLTIESLVRIAFVLGYRLDVEAIFVPIKDQQDELLEWMRRAPKAIEKKVRGSYLRMMPGLEQGNDPAIVAAEARPMPAADTCQEENPELKPLAA